jgi:hypothetical protein
VRHKAKLTDFSIASLAFIAAIACADSTGPGAPDNPGVAVVPLTVNGPRHLVWTEDGTEIVYSDFTALNAVDVSTHAVRQLDASVVISVARGRANGRIYFGTQPGGGPNLLVRRVDPAASSAETVLTTLQAGSEDFMEVSPDERFLAIGSRLFDLQTNTQPNLPSGLPYGFSPDATKLLYYADVPGVDIPSPTLISTMDRSSQALHSTDYFPIAHRWVGNSPQLLKIDYVNKNGYFNKVRLSEIDGVTGVSRDIAEFSVAAGNPFSTSWSSDGQTLATWIEQGSVADRTNRTNLFVIRSGREPALVASVTPRLHEGPPGPPIFSPSGNSVAYFYSLGDRGRSLYVISGF